MFVLKLDDIFLLVIFFHNYSFSLLIIILYNFINYILLKIFITYYYIITKCTTNDTR